ncbi:MAG TPA: PAS domain S-box protein [Melioribacteraceae bacterium]|nr:PAS domain S-box protein [Melioribacteraceae bacterium]
MAFGTIQKKQAEIDKLFGQLQDNFTKFNSITEADKNFLNLLDEFVFICDTNYNIIFANNSFYDFFNNNANKQETNFTLLLKEKLSHIFLTPKNCITFELNNLLYLFNYYSQTIELDNGKIAIFYAETQNLEEKSFHDLNEEFKALWELSNNCLRIVDENGILLNVNSNFCKLVKKGRYELIGEYYDCIYANPHPKPLNFLKNFKPRFETRISLWNGDKYYFDILSTIITYPKGTKAVLSVIRDITVLRETENKLENIQRKFNETAELIPQVFFEADKNGNLTYCNSYAYKLFEVDEKVGEKTYNIINFIAPESKEAAIKNFSSRLKNNTITSNEYTFITPSGRKIPVLVYSAPILKDNEIEGLRGIIIDISERKKLEEVGRKNEHLYRTIVNTSPDGISLMDLNGQIIFANDKKANLFGYKNGMELIGINAFDLVSDESASKLNESYFSLLKTSKIDKILLNLKRKDSSTFWGEFRAQLITDNNGKPINIMDIVTDVSDRLIAEEERKLNELRTETLLKIYQMNYSADFEIVSFLLKESVIQTNSDGGYLLFFDDNEDIDRIVIYYKEELICIKKDDDPITIDKSNLPLWLYPLKIRDQIIFNDYSDIYYKQIKLPKLDVTIKRILAIPIFNNNKMSLIAGLINKKHPYSGLDSKQFMLMMNSLNTALEKYKNDENLKIFKKAIEQNPTIIIITGADRIIKYANNKFTEVTGYKNNFVIGKTTSELGLFPYKGEDEYNKAAINTLKIGGEWKGEIEFKKADGNYCWLMLYISPMKNDKDQITNFIGIAQDITERKNIDKQLIEAKEIAEKSDRLKSEFLAQMSHEIRTPINVILSFMGLIRDELNEHLDDDLRNSFSSINRAGSRLIRTIDLLLNMSELQTGTYDYNPDHLNLDKDILQPLVTESIYSAKSKGLTLDYENNINVPIIYGDTYSIYQIFSNLVDNAIKFTKQGEVKLSLNYENGKIVCCVKDTGVGISEEYIPILFTPFSQEQQGYTRSFEGNGLGLAIVKKYCELNNAEITCSSKKGEGSCFKVSFNIVNNN